MSLLYIVGMSPENIVLQKRIFSIIRVIIFKIMDLDRGNFKYQLFCFIMFVIVKLRTKVLTSISDMHHCNLKTEHIKYIFQKSLFG